MKNNKFHFETNCLNGFTDPSDDEVTFGTIETWGNTLEECLDNATIGRTDWHGNELEHWNIGDLRMKEYDIAEKKITELFHETRGTKVS